MIQQFEIVLPPLPRGFHLITDQIMEGIDSWPQVGLLHVFLKHTSAGLSLNENTDPTVRMDFATVFDKLVPENMPYYRHTFEGADDMPAHIKSALVGTSLQIPITNGKPNLGPWQGIYLCEFRNHVRNRRLVVTIYC